MDLEKMTQIIASLPSSNIYELLYLNDIEVIEFEKMNQRKADSMICANDGNFGIFIKPDLPEKYKQFLLWHEFGHYTLHYDPDMHFNFYLSRYKWRTEHEANTFAALALLSDHELENVNVISLLQRKGVPEEIALRVFETMRKGFKDVE